MKTQLPSIMQQINGVEYEVKVTYEWQTKNASKTIPTHSPIPSTPTPSTPARNTPARNTPARNPSNPANNTRTPAQRPETNTPKFPATYKTDVEKKPDPKGEIDNIFFCESDGRTKKSSLKQGEQVIVRIETKKAIGKYIQYKVWEKDAGVDDLIFTSPTLKIEHDNALHQSFTITQKCIDEAKDFYIFDTETQQYYIEAFMLELQGNNYITAKHQGSERKSGVTAVKVGKNVVGKKDCGGKFCIDKNSPPSELIREINIRLAGFGGNVPTDKFTDRTEKMIKQFQRDYMKVPETGKVCGNVLKAIDEFCDKWSEKIVEYTCLCKNVNSITNKCSGFGKGRYKNEYSRASNKERYHKYERPGIHRSLLWGTSALRFYLSLQNEFKYLRKTAGYRCWDHNNSVPRRTTNHMGKAVDIQFSKNGIEITGKSNSNLPLLRELNEKFFKKYLNSKYEWVNGDNNFSIEPFGLGDGHTWSWIHFDVREFDNEFLDDKYFVKTQSNVKGKNIVVIANENGLSNLCNCGGGFNSKSNNSNLNKYKWAHSEFANVIGEKESNNDYNICNQTKTGRVVPIRNLKVTETKIKEIVEKQKNRDVFAVGRFQMIPVTFNNAIKTLNLDENEFLSEEMQDRIFDEYLIDKKRPKIIKYLESDGNLEDAIYAAAQEWASIGVEKGKKNIR